MTDEDGPTEDVSTEDSPTEDVPIDGVPTEDVPSGDGTTEDVPLHERIVTGLAALVSASILGTVLKGLSILVLARYLLSPSEYGLLFLALSLVMFVAMFAGLGIPRSAARYISEYRETDPGQVPHIIRTALAYNLVTVAVFGGALFLFAEPIAGLVGEPSLAPFVALGAVLMAASSLAMFTRTLFQGLNRVTYSALVSLLIKAGEFGFVIGLALLTGTVLGAFVGYVLGSLVGMVVGGVILYRQFYRQFPRAPSMEPGLARRIFEYNLPLMTSKGAGAILSKTDIVLVGVFWNPLVVGFYTLGLQIAEFVATPASSLGYAISPTFGEHKAKDDLGSAATVYEESFRHTLALYLPAVVGLVLVAGSAVPLVFGTSYAQAVPVVQVLGAFIVLKSINAITNTTLDYLGIARLRAYAKVAGAGMNVVLNVALIPVYGAVGAAAATVLTYGLLVGVNVALVARALPLSTRRLGRITGRVALVGVGMGVVVFPAAGLIQGLPTLAAVVVLGGVTWAVLAVATGLLDPAQVLRLLRASGPGGSTDRDEESVQG